MKKNVHFAALFPWNLALITHNAPLSLNPSIENFDVTNLRGDDQNVRYIEVIVDDWFVTQVTSVELL